MVTRLAIVSGHNCMYQGHIIPVDRNVTMPSGHVVYCEKGGITDQVFVYNHEYTVVG